MLERRIKEDIYSLLVTHENFIHNAEGLAIINHVWSLETMPSKDPRFKDAYGDFHQHIINNDDWELNYIFKDRLNFFGSDDYIIFNFIEAFVSPHIRGNIDFIIQYVKDINIILQDTGNTLRITGYFGELPLYQIRSINYTIALPTDIKMNQIPFYKETFNNKVFPCFILKQNYWDDFGYKTTVELNYFDDANNFLMIGYPKIMKKGMSKNIWEELPESFYELSDDYCSLGGDEDYYILLKSKFNINFTSLLLAFRDSGMFSTISEEFESESIFKTSLIRENYVEKLWRTIRFKMAGVNLVNAFKFRYNFIPPYSETKMGVEFNFDFVYNELADIEHRTYVVIGKNGTGKTRMLSGIANELSKTHSNSIGPSKPLYSKIFTLSYSIFDKFDIAQANTAFNYQYCGLKKSVTEYYTDEELRIKFVEAVTLIIKRDTLHSWYEFLGSFVNSDALNKIIITENNVLKFLPHRIIEFFNYLSSGQHILVYVLTQMFAHIRENSLILFDEPETHLHPNAISELMNRLLKLVKDYKSFCIIATHSPIVVQCIQSRNVFIVERIQDDMELRSMDRESFGENLTVITDDIFGNREIERDYLVLLEDLKNKGLSYTQIIETLENENKLPMTLNVRLQLKSLFLTQ